MKMSVRWMKLNIENVVEFVDKNHPVKVATGRPSELFNSFPYA